MTNIDFNTLGVWPEDCLRQQAFMSRLQNKLNQLKDEVETASSSFVLLSQTTEPTQGNWESAYTAQTGGSTPIPTSATLVWFNSATSEIAGVYGTINGTGTVQRRGMRYGSGITHFQSTQYDNNARSSNRTGYENISLVPSISMTTYVITNLILEFSVSITSGGSNGGIDFLVNTTKVGTQYASVPPNGGIIEGLQSGRNTARFVVPNLPPGTYTLRPLIGVVGGAYSGTSIGWGGNGNVTRFSAMAVIP